MRGVVSDNMGRFAEDRGAMEARIQAEIETQVGDIVVDIDEAGKYLLDDIDPKYPLTGTGYGAAGVLGQKFYRMVMGNFGLDEITTEDMMDEGYLPNATRAATTTGEVRDVYMRDRLGNPELRRAAVSASIVQMLDEAGALPQDISTQDRKMVLAFLRGENYFRSKDSPEGSAATSPPEMRHLERIEGFDAYNFGHALLTIDEATRNHRTILAAERDPSTRADIEAAILALDGFRELGIHRTGQSLTAGQTSESFRGIANALQEEDVSAEQLENTIDLARRRGMDEDEIAALLSGVEIDYGGMDARFGTGLDEDVTADELGEFLDIFSTVDRDLAANLREVAQEDRKAKAKTSSAKAKSQVDLAAELAAIRDPESDIGKELTALAEELENAGLVTAEDIAAIEMEDEEAEEARGNR
jgi:hypothetical protein